MLAALLASVTLNVSSADESATPSAKSGSISGRVVDSSGAPLAGACVWLHKYDNKASTPGAAGSKIAVDQAGKFRFADLADGYFFICAEAQGLATVRLHSILKDAQDQEFTIVLRPPVESFIQFRDESNKPVIGVTIRELVCQDDNGKLEVWASSWMPLGLSIAPSDSQGLLQLPPLSDKTTIIEAMFDCPGYTPVKINNVGITSGEIATVKMKPGVTVTLRMAPASDGKIIDHAMLRVVHNDDTHDPSSIYNYRLPIRPDGSATISLEPGKYEVLELQSDDGYISPHYANSFEPLEIAPGRNDRLQFTLRHKVKVSGRVVNAARGEPIKDAWVEAEVPNQPASEWTNMDGADVDADGRFVLEVPPGAIHLAVKADNYLMEKSWIDMEVGENPFAVPDVKLFPTPTITGRVVDTDGRPVAGAILRFRGFFQFHRHPPAATDKDGRFSFHVEKVPDDFDSKIGEMAWHSPLDVCDPARPLSTRIEVNLNKPEEFSDMTIKLKPESYDEFFRRARLPTTKWMQGFEAMHEKHRAAEPTSAWKASSTARWGSLVQHGKTNGQPGRFSRQICSIGILGCMVWAVSRGFP